MIRSELLVFEARLLHRGWAAADGWNGSLPLTTGHASCFANALSP
jgi:hypothetical protein